MQGCVIGAHVVPEQAVKLCQGGDGLQVKGIEPGLLQGSELALDFGLGCAVPDLCVEQDGADGAADQGKLLADVTTAIVNIQFCRDSIGGHGVPEYFLEVVSIVVVEKSAAHQETGVVINNHDTVDPPALSVFGDMRQVTGVSLPHLSKGILLECLPVPHVRVTCRFQVMFFDKALDGADADGGGNESIFHKVVVDLGGVKLWEPLFEMVDFTDGGIGKSP